MGTGGRNERDLWGGRSYEGGWFCEAPWELASDRLPKGGQEVFYVWGQTWVGSFQGESGGDSYYVSWQPKRTQVSLSPALCSTYKATGAKDPSTGRLVQPWESGTVFP